MTKLVAIMLSVSALASAGRADAQDLSKLNKDWNRYLKGQWTYEITPLNIKGTVTWRTVAKGNALVARFVNEDGSTEHELGGYRSDTKTRVAQGYDSNGGYWHLDLPKITADVMEGLNYGVMPDGRTYKGTFTAKRVDEDHYEWHFKGKTGDGEELTMTGKYTRKKK